MPDSPTTVNNPQPQHGPNGPQPVEQQVRAVLDALAQRPKRDAQTGRFVEGTPAAMKTGEGSGVFWCEVAEAKRELMASVLADLAVDANTPATLVGVIEAYAEARLLRTAMFLRLGDQGGPVTTKGKTRALFKSYLAALDRETRLAQVLGLVRRQKHIDPLDAVRAAVVEANSE
jgi:hypothetical protein